MKESKRNRRKFVLQRMILFCVVKNDLGCCATLTGQWNLKLFWFYLWYNLSWSCSESSSGSGLLHRVLERILLMFWILWWNGSNWVTTCIAAPRFCQSGRVTNLKNWLTYEEKNMYSLLSHISYQNKVLTISSKTSIQRLLFSIQY